MEAERGHGRNDRRSAEPGRPVHRVDPALARARRRPRSSATSARAPASCARASAGCASCGVGSTTRSCWPATAARPGSASTRSRRSRSTTSCPARRCSRSARPAATSPAGSARTGTSPSRARSTRCRRRPRRQTLADTAARLGCRSVAFTYNDPVIFMEYAMDVADACRAQGIKAVAVSAGFMNAAPRPGVLRAHGRGQHRPQGVHRGLLREGHLRQARAPCWTPCATCGTRPTSGSRSPHC